MADVDFLLDMRNRARRAGDRGIAAACTADLERVGYRESVVTETGRETATDRPPERAIPQAQPTSREPRRKGGRPPLPRCSHGQVVGRCGKCDTAA